MIFVVGSGPSGVAATSALLASGHQVTMLDYGLELEPQRQEAISELKALPPAQWPAETIALLKGEVQSSRHGVSKKKSYGSDFVFRETSFVQNLNPQVDAKPTLSKGGFSNTWGSVVLPYRDQDLKDWPLKRNDLEKHYQEVSALIGVSGVKDSLEKHFPFYGTPSQPLKTSSQAESMLSTLEVNKEKNEDEGFFFGRSRLAVRAESTTEGPGCVRCGLCLYGCPYELIYNSSFTLKKFKSNPNFHYRPGVYVEKVGERGDGVEILARDLSTQEKVSFHGDRVYLGGGVLSSTRIMLASLGVYDREIVIKDSQYFILPYLLRAGSPNVEKEELHTLCQLLIEVMDDKLSSHAINLQLYTYNDLYSQVVRGSLGPLGIFLKPFLPTILGRLVAFQGYLHSNDSSIMNAKLIRVGDDSSRLVLTSRQGRWARPLLKSLVKKMNKSSWELGGWALGPLMTVAVPGEGNHYGGSFPMRTTPQDYETDLAGRPHGYKRVHLVDASVFPSIPATTITFTIMANAHRIASMDL